MYNFYTPLAPFHIGSGRKRGESLVNDDGGGGGGDRWLREKRKKSFCLALKLVLPRPHYPPLAATVPGQVLQPLLKV